MQIKAGTAFIDVELRGLEKIQAELRRKMSSVGSEVAKDFNKTVSDKIGDDKGGIFSRIFKGAGKAGSSAGEGFIESFSNSIRIATPIVSTTLMAVLVAAAVAAAPAVFAALGAGLVGGIPIGVIAGGFALVADDPKIKAAGKKLKENLVGDLKDAAQPLVKPFLDSIGIIQSSFNKMLPDIKASFQNVAPFITGLTKGAMDGLSGIANGIKNLTANAGPVVEAFGDLFREAGVAIGKMFTEISKDPETIKSLTNLVKDLSKGLALLIGWIGNLIKWGAQWYENQRNLIKLAIEAKNKIVSAWNSVKSAISSAVSWVVSKVSAFGSALAGFYGKYVKPFVDKIASGVSAVVGKFKELVQKIKDKFEDFSLYDIGVNLIQGLINGIRAMAGKLFSVASDIAGGVIDRVKKIFDIGSPSKVFEQIGKWNVEGLAKGMAGMAEVTAMALPSRSSFTHQVSHDFGSPASPLMDQTGPGVTINKNFYEVDKMDPWRDAENDAWLLRARGYV